MNIIHFQKETPSFESDLVPIFQPNQVLTHKDLNDLVVYLDSHNRLTRTHLIGMGIVCGLEVIPFKIEKAEELYIYITPGCGITSEGFLIQHPPDITTHITQNKNSFNCYQTTSLPKQLFDTSESPQAFFEAKKLLHIKDVNSINDSTIKTLTIEQLQEQVVLILCDWEQKERDTCTTDCDSLGEGRKFDLNFFLIDKSHAQKFLATEFSPPLTISLQSWFEVPDCQIQRLGYGIKKETEGFDLAEITTFEELRNAYKKVCKEGINQIDKSLQQIDKLFNPLFSSFSPEKKSFDTFDNLKIHLSKLLTELLFADPSSKKQPTQVGYGIQYFYDYLVELATAFNELKDALFDLMDDCLPSRERFPIYLLAGEVGEVKTLTEDTIKIPIPPLQKVPPSIYRHPFYQPPIHNGNQKRKQEVRHLYERLLMMIQPTSFNLLPVKYTPIKITPSRHRQVSLGEQAIPYYYDYINLYDRWNYDAYRKQKAKDLPAYFRFKTKSSQELKKGYDLINRFDWADFFRIEGHLGRSLKTILDELNFVKKNFNLSFDIVPIRLGYGEEDPSTLKGYFEDLEKDFNLIKIKWKKNPLRKQIEQNKDNYPITWKIVECFDELFFSQQDLTQIKLASIENDFLNYAQDPNNYEFQTDRDNKYRLVLKFPGSNPQDENDRIALFTQQADTGSQIERTVDFNFIRSSFSEDNKGEAEKIQKNKDGIIQKFVDCFSDNPTTLQVEKDPENDKIYRMILRNGTETIQYVEGTQIPENFPSSFLLQLEDETAYRKIDEEAAEDKLIARYQNFEALYSILKFFVLEEYGEGFDHAGLVFYYELRALFYRYLQRLEVVKYLQEFSGFVKENRGLEHLGGVPKGGTLVMVYTEDEQVITNLKNQDGKLQDNAKKIVEEMKKKLTFPAEEDTESSEKVSKDESEETVKEIKRKDILAVADNPENPEKVSKNETKKIGEQPVSYKMVIADFCLPYYCCGNNSINYVITPPRPLIQLPKSVFCEKDETIYDFVLYPPNGLLKKRDGIVSHNGQYGFQPSQVDGDIKEPTNITFFYVVEGVSNSFSILMLPLVGIILTAPKSVCLPADNQQKKLITLRVKLSLEVAPSEGTFEISTDGGTVYKKIAHETINVVKDNEDDEYKTFDVSFDSTLIPFGDSQKRLTVYFKHIIPGTDDYCGNSSEPLPIILLRTPKAEIDYNKNNNNHQEVFGKLVHTSEDDCNQLAQEVQFYGSQADIYQWRLNGKTLDNGKTRNLTIELPYTPKKSATVTLHVANKYDDIKATCLNSITIEVSLPELDPYWTFDPHSESNTPLPTRTETSNTSENSEIIVLCRHEYPKNLITVKQPGGTFSSKPKGLIPELVNPNKLPCSEQNKYVLDVSSDKFTHIFDIYTLTYTLPDGSEFSRLVEVIDLPERQVNLRLRPILASDPQQFEVNLVADTVVGNTDPQGINPEDILYQWDLTIGQQTITTHSETLALNYDGGTYEEENHDPQTYDKIEPGELISVALQVSSIHEICKKTFQSQPDHVPLEVTRLELYQGSLGDNNQVYWQSLRTLEDGVNIPIANLGRVALKIQAVTFPHQVGSVKFTLNKQKLSQTTSDNLNPYEFYGPTNLVVIFIILLLLIFLLLRRIGLDKMALLTMTTYYPQQFAPLQVVGWWPQEGKFILTVTPYQEANLQGYAGPTKTVTFSLVSSLV